MPSMSRTGAWQGHQRDPLLNRRTSQTFQRHQQSSRRKRSSGLCFLVCLVHVVFFVYIAYGALLLVPMVYPEHKWYKFIYPIFFHIVFFLFLGAFFKAAATDPGQVPSQYAFHMGDERKRRRYCKICNVWKPDRAHHCSACNRCVLNMDHHCPWLNNCVGFENRKYFVQLLVYALIICFLITVHGLLFLSFRGGDLLPKGSVGGDAGDEQKLNSGDPNSPPNSSGGDMSSTDERVAGEIFGIAEFFVLCVITLFALVLVLALVPFTRFHFRLIMMNSTTIESLDAATAESARYDLGTVERNCQQVCGRNPGLYFLPCDMKGTMPVGDGVNWGENYRRILEEQNIGGMNPPKHSGGAGGFHAQQASPPQAVPSSSSRYTNKVSAHGRSLQTTLPPPAEQLSSSVTTSNTTSNAEYGGSRSQNEGATSSPSMDGGSVEMSRPITSRTAAKIPARPG